MHSLPCNKRRPHKITSGGASSQGTDLTTGVSCSRLAPQSLTSENKRREMVQEIVCVCYVQPNEAREGVSDAICSS